MRSHTRFNVCNQTGTGKLRLLWLLFYRLWQVYHCFSFETMVYYHYQMGLAYSWSTVILFWSQPDNSSLTWTLSGTHGTHETRLWRKAEISSCENTDAPPEHVSFSNNKNKKCFPLGTLKVQSLYFCVHGLHLVHLFTHWGWKKEVFMDIMLSFIDLSFHRLLLQSYHVLFTCAHQCYSCCFTSGMKTLRWTLSAWASWRHR